MRVGSLFSGYGGLDLAVLNIFPDASLAWHCEWEDAPSRILEKHFPDVPNYRDVTQPVFTAIQAVLGSLADLGYDARWTGVRAADAGAPHNRFRVFIIAYPRGLNS